MMNTERIVPGDPQPRRAFDENALAALAESVKRFGIIQPLVVRPRADGGATYDIVAGERRWRAARIADIVRIPVIVRRLSDVEAFEVSLVENVQRRDINPVEESDGYRMLMERYGYAQAEIAAVVGKSRSHVANMLRIGSASPKLRQYLTDGRLDMGHVRALLGHAHADAVADEVASSGLSVRETEKLAARHGVRQKTTTAADPSATASATALAKTLSDGVGLIVDVKTRARGGGAVNIRYETPEQLEFIVKRLMQERWGPNRDGAHD